MALCIYIDGGARGNPGPAAAGVLIHEGDPSAPLHEGGYFLGRMTNNMAEYQGLLIALELAVQTGADEISVHSDSQLLVRQIEGKYRVQSSLLKPLYEQAKKHLKAFAHWKITHIRREFNVRADALANLAMDAGDDVIVVALSGKIDRPHAKNGVNQTSESSNDQCPSWTVQLVMEGKNCECGSTGNVPYLFGPTTPEGFCVYAAKAVLDETIENGEVKPPKPIQTRCQHCGAAIAIQPAS